MRFDTYMANLLLVDDNDFNLFILEQIVADAGHTYHLSLSGSEAVQITQKEHFDLVFMDIHMPSPNGIESTRLIRNHLSAQELPIIGLSGENDQKVIEEAKKAGMNDFLSKPFKSKTLLKIIADYL